VAARRERLRSLAKIGVFDIGGPLVVYSLLTSDGFSAVAALIISGTFPAIGVIISVLQNRRLDFVGVFVLAGILVGTALGLLTHNARLVLLEGSVPTGILGLICIGSLWIRRPLIYVFALEFMGPGTAKGRDFAALWQYPLVRHSFRVMTAVWGIGYLIEAGVRVIIVEHTSTGTALAASKISPYVFAGVLSGWTILYGVRMRRRGERMAAAAQAQSTAAQQGGSADQPNPTRRGSEAANST